MANQRTGLRTLRNIAQRSCRLLALFTPIIRRVYPTATALHIALDALNVACAAVVLEADAVLPVGD